jgi:ABC-type amino acid transport substrate-binding protein
VGRFC